MQLTFFVKKIYLLVKVQQRVASPFNLLTRVVTPAPPSPFRLFRHWVSLSTQLLVPQERRRSRIHREQLSFTVSQACHPSYTETLALSVKSVTVFRQRLLGAYQAVLNGIGWHRRWMFVTTHDNLYHSHQHQHRRVTTLRPIHVIFIISILILSRLQVQVFQHEHRHTVHRNPRASSRMFSLTGQNLGRFQHLERRPVSKVTVKVQQKNWHLDPDGIISSHLSGNETRF